MERARPALDDRIDHRHHGQTLKITALREVVEANLASFEQRVSDPPATPAAVAVAVMELDGEAAIPIFQRTSDMSRHAGQMALPGGKLHAGESVEEAAIRELREELGLDAREVVGRLDDFDTRSGFTITPVVIWSGRPASVLRPSPSEVARLFVVPVDVLRAAAARARSGVHFSLRLPGVEVFAPTAAMLYQFSELAVGGRDVRVADFYQPPFTHR